MNKKNYKFIFIGLLALLAVTLVFSISKKVIYKQNIEKNTQSVQDFCAIDIRGKKYCTKELLDQAILITFYHPECDMCQGEVDQLRLHADAFADISILMITNASTIDAKAFYTKNKINELPNVRLLFDTGMAIHAIFDVAMIPTSFLYNKNRKLIRKFTGEVKAETLLKYLNE